VAPARRLKNPSFSHVMRGGPAAAADPPSRAPWSLPSSRAASPIPMAGSHRVEHEPHQESGGDAAAAAARRRHEEELQRWQASHERSHDEPVRGRTATRRSPVRELDLSNYEYGGQRQHSVRCPPRSHLWVARFT
jgi:hypothetical protein